MHYGNGTSYCKDITEEQKRWPCSDQNTTEFMKYLLEREKPDLVVFTGDNIYGMSCPDPSASMMLFREPLEKANVPWTIVFGNHDDEGMLSRQALMAVDVEAKLSLSMAGTSLQTFQITCLKLLISICQLLLGHSSVADVSYVYQ